MSADAGKDSKAGKRKEKKSEKLTSKQIRAKYAERERSIMRLFYALAELYHDDEELAEMNRGKRGRSYKYTHSFMVAVARIRTHFAMSYSGCEGLWDEGCGPEFTTIWKRLKDMDASIRASLSDVSIEDVAFTLIPDGTGLTPATRSEYVRVVHKLRRGFLRLTIMIHKETLEIVAFQLTDDSVGETTVFNALLDEALANMGMDQKKRRVRVREEKDDLGKSYTHIEIIADGAYDKRETFATCKKPDIEPTIRTRKDANLKAGGADGAGAEAVRKQRGGSPDITAAEFAAPTDSEREANFAKWKKSVVYGTRWLVEIVISAFKRTYGDSVSARKMENIRQEIRLKICEYNMMLQVGREAAMEA